jgi:hypothetical protein
MHQAERAGDGFHRLKHGSVPARITLERLQCAPHPVQRFGSRLGPRAAAGRFDLM